ncbi:hypothetical protein R5H30_05430 [Sulfitobacter sp. D35]|uniref:COG3904 family protein n=1 Tax=Sulfitobacter sp. D35 TaxID=3083252 RepID=UPI00296EB286|nr:hypothetical protein [Sulfitobacter sp. D35]MDW4497415.1 hypothetical protein [Sulfitobacter sp. D35]
MSTEADRADGGAIRKGVRLVLFAQIALAGLLVLSQLPDRMLFPSFDTEALPTGPVSPGDQRRRFREDDTNPAYLTREGTPALPQPDSMPSTLDFSIHEVEGQGRTLRLMGAIAPGDAERLEDYLGTLGTPPDLVALDSPGGVVAEALRLGRLIRERGYPTGVLSGSTCASSCPYVLAGGTERIVSRNAAVGMHQHYYEAEPLLPVFMVVKDIQRGQGLTMDYLIEMDVDPAVMRYSLNTPPEAIYILVEDELTNSRLATRLID